VIARTVLVARLQAAPSHRRRGAGSVVDVNDWTSQAFGIGEIGEVFDATRQSVTLDLIDCPVRAFGGSSSVGEGCIRAPQIALPPPRPRCLADHGLLRVAGILL